MTADEIRKARQFWQGQLTQGLSAIATARRHDVALMWEHYCDVARTTIRELTLMLAVAEAVAPQARFESTGRNAVQVLAHRSTETTGLRHGLSTLEMLYGTRH